MADDEDTQPDEDDVASLLPTDPLPAAAMLCNFCDDREKVSAYMDLSNGDRQLLCWRCFALQILQIDVGDLDLARTGAAAAGVLRDAQPPSEPEEELQPAKKPRMEATRTTSSLCDHPCHDCQKFQIAFRCYSKAGAARATDARNLCWACTAKCALMAHTGLLQLTGLAVQYNDPPR